MRSSLWGDWADLDTAAQWPRYETIARLLHDLRADRAVLDVGCGAALLKRFLPSTCTYLGLDLSADALSHAGEAIVMQGRAEDCPPIHIETVVFNEMLYYCADPVGVFRSLSRHARVVACSIYQRTCRPSWKTRLHHTIDHRVPLTNTHCDTLIQQAAQDWTLTHDLRLPGDFHVWAATQQPLEQVAATDCVRLAYRG